jgi:hypothetical protein
MMNRSDLSCQQQTAAEGFRGADAVAHQADQSFERCNAQYAFEGTATVNAASKRYSRRDTIGNLSGFPIRKRVPRAHGDEPNAAGVYAHRVPRTRKNWLKWRPARLRRSRHISKPFRKT